MASAKAMRGDIVAQSTVAVHEVERRRQEESLWFARHAALQHQANPSLLDDLDEELQEVNSENRWALKQLRRLSPPALPQDLIEHLNTTVSGSEGNHAREWALVQQTCLRYLGILNKNAGCWLDCPLDVFDNVKTAFNVSAVTAVMLRPDTRHNLSELRKYMGSDDKTSWTVDEVFARVRELDRKLDGADNLRAQIESLKKSVAENAVAMTAKEQRIEALARELASERQAQSDALSRETDLKMQVEASVTRSWHEAELVRVENEAEHASSKIQTEMETLRKELDTSKEALRMSDQDKLEITRLLLDSCAVAQPYDLDVVAANIGRPLGKEAIGDDPAIVVDEAALDWTLSLEAPTTSELQTNIMVRLFVTVAGGEDWSQVLQCLEIISAQQTSSSVASTLPPAAANDLLAALVYLGRKRPVEKGSRDVHVLAFLRTAELVLKLRIPIQRMALNALYTDLVDGNPPPWSCALITAFDAWFRSVLANYHEVKTLPYHLGGNVIAQEEKCILVNARVQLVSVHSWDDITWTHLPQPNTARLSSSSRRYIRQNDSVGSDESTLDLLADNKSADKVLMTSKLAMRNVLKTAMATLGKIGRRL